MIKTAEGVTLKMNYEELVRLRLALVDYREKSIRCAKAAAEDKGALSVQREEEARQDAAFAQGLLDKLV